MKKVKITLVKRKFGRKPGHLECIHGLGLRKIRQFRIVEDTDCNRGMINKVSYLLKVEEV